MVVFCIQKLLLIYIALIICSLELNKHVLFFKPLLSHRTATIMGSICHLLAGEYRGNLQTYCPHFCDIQLPRRSDRFYSWDPAEYNFSEYYHLNKLSTHSHSLTIYPLPSSINVYRYSFFVNSIFLWNSIPFDVLSAPRTLFKYKLKQFLF